MEAPEQVAAYAAADFADSDQAMVDRIVEMVAGRRIQRVVDLGCGPGNITLRLAEALPEAEVIGVDGAGTMLAVARARVPEPDRRRVEFLQAVLPSGKVAMPCDLVVSNSLLHHLHDPSVFWREVRAWARPDAFVFVGDLSRPESPARVDALVEAYAHDAPPVLQEDFRASLFAAFDDDELRAQLAEAGLAHLDVDHPTDRHVHLFGPLTPA